LTVRRANPEGVSLVNQIRVGPGRAVLHVDRDGEVSLAPPPARVCLSRYHLGDVLRAIDCEGEADVVSCPVGLATAAALYRLTPATPLEVTARVPLPPTRKASLATHRVRGWQEGLRPTCTL